MEKGNNDLEQEDQDKKSESENVPPVSKFEETSSDQTVKEIHHHHYKEKKKGFNFGRFLFGILIIIVGLGFLASTMGWTNWGIFDFTRLWPVIVVIVGISILSFRGWLGTLIGIIVTIIVIAVTFVLVFGSVGLSFPGTGQVIEQDRTVANFNKVELNGIGNLIVTQGETESLKISAEDNIISQIKTEVVGDVLKISYESNWAWFSLRPSKNINFYVTAKDINGINISGAGEIKSDYINTQDLRIDIRGAGKADLVVSTTKTVINISGAGQAVVSGNSQVLEGKISGAGKIDASNLIVSSADIETSGAGQATVNATDNLKVRISGAGKIWYVGDPNIDEVISGVGSIEKLR